MRAVVPDVIVAARHVGLSGVGRARAGVAFLADPLWWLAGAGGLVLTVGMLRVAPQALAGSALHGVPVWLSCVLWQPILEEATFRGVLQGGLLRSRWGGKRWVGVSAANLTCSAAFTAAHFVHHPPLWAASVLLPSLLFGWLRERHGGLGAPIGLHVLFNLEFFAAAALAVG
jgi:hypothetical protein